MKKANLRQEREWHRREDYKRFILKAAGDVIARKGYSATTMDDVAEEAQFSKATLYHYFKSKGEMIFEIIAGYFEELKKKLAEIQKMEKNTREKLRQAIECVLEFHEEKENISQVFMMDESIMKKMKIFITDQQKLTSDVDRKYVNLIRNERDEIFKVICELLREGVAAREFRKMNIAAAATFLGALLQGYCHGKFWLQRSYSRSEESNLLYSFFLRGIEERKEHGKGE